MGKAHRDNHAARLKRGEVAFGKKAKRRMEEPRCLRCGTKCRRSKLNKGICPVCMRGDR